ncbi:hypothetical protein RM780_07825 [Streptomyces sp. DSM 44917]|uniref:Phage tail protein n=1 Tax=Streptomyces boetiae TaxID=3075541 RepID=A0ABU2L5P1_9ACTN|nr:hypothetical protein [Streptomyces sp. DSM 44917]MDT0306871.1 hypothetical protein [Streptomyces sp. DSM 44917]
MPMMVLTAQFLSINSVDLSSYTRKAELSVEVEDKDVTTYSSLGWKVVLGGLKSGELGIEFLQDVAAGQIDSIMWPLLGTVVPFSTRLTQDAVGTSNPAYSGNVLIKKWSPIEGGIGDEASVGVSYPTSGAVTRATS